MQRIGVDVGGTFTDVILVNSISGEVIAVKVPTTPEDPSAGVVNGIRAAMKEAGVNGADVGFVGHGTTIATNLLVEGKGAKVGLLTTQGFRDVLEIRRAARHDRADLYDMFFDEPRPLVRRRLRREVRERILHDGRIQVPLDEEQLAKEIEAIKMMGAESVAISFLHAYVNPLHERRAAEVVGSLFPEAFVTTSSEVNPEIYEYERTSTTVINALLGPKCEAYLSSLEKRVADEGVNSGVHLMQSNGGLTRPRDAARLPVTLLESGPAGGVTAVVKLCQRMKLANGIMGDVGGTTFDVSVVRDFRPELRKHTEIDSYAVRAPTIDIVSVGAGGGSIASVDVAGGVQVGPRSAGADPGPVCYGRGGSQVTVTDCNVVLGYLDASRPLGGFKLDVDAARKAIEEKLARPLGMTMLEAARTVRAIANAHMAQAIRLVTVERGYDPRDFAYIPVGGGGPVHAVDVAELLEVETVVVPPHPGLFSALGMLVADMVHDFQSPLMRNAADVDAVELADAFRKLEAQAFERMALSSIAADKVMLQHWVDCRHLGQAESITIELPDADLAGSVGDAIRKRFTTEHQRQWNFTLKRPVLVTNVRVRAVCAIGDYVTGRNRPASGAPQSTGCRDVLLSDAFQSIPCYERYSLPLGYELEGPAVIEEPSTSLVLKAGHKARVDEDGNLIVTLKG